MVQDNNPADNDAGNGTETEGPGGKRLTQIVQLGQSGQDNDAAGGQSPEQLGGGDQAVDHW